MLVIVVVVTVMVVVEMTIEKGGQWNDCSMRNWLHSVIRYFI
jgi:hypothetical protein